MENQAHPKSKKKDFAIVSIVISTIAHVATIATLIWAIIGEYSGVNGLGLGVVIIFMFFTLPLLAVSTTLGIIAAVIHKNKKASVALIVAIVPLVVGIAAYILLSTLML